MNNFVSNVVLLMPCLHSCAPEFDVRNSRVDEERVIAVVAEPAEARPGELVRYVLLAVGPQGAISEPKIEWSYCMTPKAFVDNNTVAEACLSEAGERLNVEPGGTASGRIPADACRLHGSDPPPGDARPRDPDATGGYYQPVRLVALGEVSFHLQRIRCNPGDVAADVAQEFSAQYGANQNPASLRWVVEETEQSVDSTDAEPSVLRLRSAEAELTVEWDAPAREEFAVIDKAGQTVTQQLEALSADWFVTAGTLEVDRHAHQDPTDRRRSFSNVYRPPSSGTAHLWVVLRDSRGGSATLYQRLSR